VNLRPPSRVAAPALGLEDLAPFAGLGAAALAELAAAFERREVRREAVLFHEGDAPEWMYFVLAGQVKLMKHAEDGRVVILRLALPGDLLGGVSAYGRRPHPFTAQAMAPTEVLRVAGADYAAIMDERPEVARWTLADLIEQLTEAHETMKSLAVERVEQRVARQLLRLAERAGQPTPEGTRLAVGLSRQDLADLAGTTVETAIRVLSRWRRRGLVGDQAGHLLLRDLEALRELAQDGA
jgi:CRP/FNR family transcriptional regulator